MNSLNFFAASEHQAELRMMPSSGNSYHPDRIVGRPADSISGTASEVRARVTSSHFVGRLSELEELARASREAAEGVPGLVLLGGDSGLGKTRLVAEFERRAADQPILVLRGEAVEQTDGELPYAPLISALRPLVRQRDSVLEELSPGLGGQLAALLPGCSAATSGWPSDSRRCRETPRPGRPVTKYAPPITAITSITASVIQFRDALGRICGDRHIRRVQPLGWLLLGALISPQPSVG
jgi:predicted ATPase